MIKDSRSLIHSFLCSFFFIKMSRPFIHSFIHPFIRSLCDVVLSPRCSSRGSCGPFPGAQLSVTAANGKSHPVLDGSQRGTAVSHGDHRKSRPFVDGSQRGTGVNHKHTEKVLPLCVRFNESRVNHVCIQEVPPVSIRLHVSIKCGHGKSRPFLDDSYWDTAVNHVWTREVPPLGVRFNGAHLSIMRIHGKSRPCLYGSVRHVCQSYVHTRSPAPLWTVQ